MINIFTLENFIKGIESALPVKVIREDEQLIFLKNFNFHEEQNIWLKVPIIEVQTIINNLADNYFMEKHRIFNSRDFEIPLKEQNIRFTPFRRHNNYPFHVSDHGYIFNISKASVQYIIALFCFASQQEEIDFEIRYNRRIFRIQNEELSSFEEINELINIQTAKISSSQDHTFSEFEKKLESYLFNVSHKFNTVFTIDNFFEDRKSLISRVKRDGQLFPYKEYNNELVTYYYQGVTTDIPFAQYMAFYHVAEFFFQTISEQEAFEEIKEFITHPSFNPYNEVDIKDFYNIIKKKIRDQRDDGVWNEKTGLLLSLKKFIPNLENLKKTIDAINSDSIEYYYKNKVPFTNTNNIVKFNNSKETYVQIRNRIYSVRIYSP